MNGTFIGDLLSELVAIDSLAINLSERRKEKCEAIKRFSEIIFDGARDTYPIDATPLYKDFEDYFVNN